MSDLNPLQDSNNTTPVKPAEINNGNAPDTASTPVFEFMDSGISSDPKKNTRKKSFHKLLPTLLLLLLLLTLGVTAFIFRDTIRNRYALFTKSPSEYYAYIETNSFQQLADGLWLYQKYASGDSSYQTTSDISFYRDALDSLSETAFGLSLKDVEDVLGISVEHIGFDFLYREENNIRSETLGVRFNQENLFTLDCYSDILKQELLLRIPELSTSYLKTSMTVEDVSSDLGILFLELLDSDKSSILIKRYGELLAVSIKQVELEKEAEITLDSLSEDVTKLTVTITKEDIFNIISAMLDAAREDEDIIELLPSLGRTTANYQQTIDTAKATLWNSYSTSTINSIQMLLSVDNKGHIISRSIGSTESSASFSYTYLNRKDDSEYQASLTDSDGTILINAYGSHRKIDRTYHGLLNVEYSNPESSYLTETDFEIAYEDVSIKPENHHLYYFGTFTLSSDDLMGMQIELSNRAANSLQHNDITFRMGASPLITIDTETEYLSTVEIPLPDSNAEIYDFAQIEDYIATFHIEEYFSDLSSKLNIDFSNLINDYLP